jgi:hypothetical protein
MLIVLILLLVLVTFDIAAMIWGADSRERPESEEWERRAQRDWPEGCAHSGASM